MKQILLSYVQYNAWANQCIIKTLNTIPLQNLDVEIAGSFNTIKKTVHHLYAAEHIWEQRLMLLENPIFLDFDESISFALLAENWLQASEKLIAFVEKQKTDEAFTHQYIYHDSKKNSYKCMVWQTVQHVCNHGTMHRGQIINYLRALDIVKLPSTDFNTWVKLQKNK